MGIIYRKTAKGLEEIQTRAYRLPPRARSALILVDGQRSDDDLAKLIQLQATETLASLREQAFIEVVSQVAPAVAPVTVSRAAPPGPAARVPEAEPAATSTDGRPRAGFQTVRREAVKRLTDLVGPAAETLAIRMERANDLDTLRPLVAQASNLIKSVRGQRQAEDYIAALSAM